MDAFAALLETFDHEFARFEASPAIRLLRSDAFRVEHYASALREIYFYTRDNPQQQCAMTLAFRGSQRQAVRRMVGHALDEVGHDRMALDDLRALGYDTESIPGEEPLPSTMPLICHPTHLLASDCPIAYLGQIFFLEFLPTRAGAIYLEALAAAGIPPEATSFLAEHATVDEAHNRLMKRHVADLVQTDRDLARCQQALRTCAYMYAAMLEGAFASAGAFTARQPRLDVEVHLEA